jgi:amino acid transporter
VAVGWSGYFVSLLDSFGVHLPHALVTAPWGDDPGIVNLPAMAIMLITSGALWLGTRESAVANNSMVLLKLSILVLVVVVGLFYVSSSNLKPFLPAAEGGFGDFGWSGVFRGAGIVFFAYIGFDAVSTAAAEARNPRRTVPVGLLGTVIIATVLRRRYPDLPRPFRVPALPLVAGTAIVSSLALMATLPGDTWIRLGVWAALGLCVYFLYAREHSKEKMGAIVAGITSTPEPAPEES